MAKAVTDPPPSSVSVAVTVTEDTTVSAGPPAKRRKVADLYREPSCHECLSSPLIPGLPDHIAHLCLSHLRPSTLFSVNRSWRRVISSPLYPPYLSLYTLLVPHAPDSHPPVLDACLPSNTTDVRFSSYDPVSSTWQSLPPPPSDLRLLLCHPSFLSRRFPIQSVSAASRLVLLAASTPDLFPALPRPLIFDPAVRTWSFGPAFSAPRRWCAAGSLGGSVYVASGISSQFSVDVARSLERWDLDAQGKGSCSRTRGWNQLNGLKDGRFCRDAIEAVGWKGRLCMVNVRGDAYKQGVVYNIQADTWNEMPEGMLKGWRGPVTAMDEETMYCIDERKGILRRYDEASDAWTLVTKNEVLIGAQQMAAARGRVCAVCKGGEIAVVDVAYEGSSPSSGKAWVVEPPPGLQAVGVHILPRMVNWDDVEI
ncbi:hypothetical protein MLD38_019100 [Melastoma candidum]|uniref:Uncharacterized protein n=1 Tax=Melastoma candidum TaxID=119954 RepID=A0ACB9QWI9_9MYRT|nr:hypothetical protein MLD38_019100 [Melastoma candidum]